MSKPRGFPVGLTLSAAIALAILVSLGVWQVQRLAWKTDMLARIAAVQTAPAQPLGPVLAKAEAGEDVEFTRVSVECPGLAKAPFEQIYAVTEGQGGVRLVSACKVGAEGYDGVLVDRGFVADTISARPPVAEDAAPLTVTGVLRRGDRKPAKASAPIGEGGAAAPAGAAQVWYGRDLAALAKALKLSKPAPYFVMAETATNPEWAALKPAPIPTDIPNNHLSYAITWFGLAAALVGVYAALLWRRLQGR
jgi:surfeit locus 1 family protein